MTMTVAAPASEAFEMTGNKLIGIEHLLRWAYRQELPKVHRGAKGLVASGGGLNGWGATERYGELMTIVDVSPNHFGVIPDLWGSDEAEPHPDALLVADAVARLAETRTDWEEGFDVLSDITMLTDVERADCNGRGHDLAHAKGEQLAALVMRVAMIGQAPDWADHGEVERRVVRNSFGQPAWFRIVMRAEGDGRSLVPVEVDGFDNSKRRPFPGAFGRTVLDPDPARLAA